MDIEHWRRVEGYVYFTGVLLFILGASIAIIVVGGDSCGGCCG